MDFMFFVSVMAAASTLNSMSDACLVRHFLDRLIIQDDRILRRQLSRLIVSREFPSTRCLRSRQTPTLLETGCHYCPTRPMLRPTTIRPCCVP